MCNINIAYAFNKKNNNFLRNYISFASWNSFKSNSHGDGIFIKSSKGNFITRSEKKLKIKDEFYFAMSHQRLATSGKGIGNVHPFQTNRFIIVHNGVFRGLGDDKHSDTYYFCQNFQSIFDELGDIVETIKKITSETPGYYSVSVYDKVLDKAYYFKESKSSMYSLVNKKYLIMSTKRENLEFAQYSLNINSDIKEVADGKIYEIFPKLKEIGTFEEYVYTYTPTVNNEPKTNYVQFGSKNYQKIQTEIPYEYELMGDEGLLLLMNEDFSRDYEPDDWRQTKLVDRNWGGYI